MNTYLLSEVAKRLGIKPYRITYALSTGRLKEPKRVAGRRLFNDKDLKAIATLFEIEEGGNND